MESLIKSVISNEGFRKRPYKDHLGNWTFGHGFTYITEEESCYLLRKRLRYLQRRLFPKMFHLTTAQQDVLVEMAYQMGISDLNSFKDMWAHIKNNECELAVKEMLDSLWERQTPGRANRLAIKFYDGGLDEDEKNTDDDTYTDSTHSSVRVLSDKYPDW
jgi:GH24 family phage-related lysozyme (muramidase)